MSHRRHHSRVWTRIVLSGWLALSFWILPSIGTAQRIAGRGGMFANIVTQQATGSAWGWGSDGNGELGDDSPPPLFQVSPVQVRSAGGFGVPQSSCVDGGRTSTGSCATRRR